jgi:hypothetical protein
LRPGLVKLKQVVSSVVTTQHTSLFVGGSCSCSLLRPLQPTKDSQKRGRCIKVLCAKVRRKQPQFLPSSRVDNTTHTWRVPGLHHHGHLADCLLRQLIKEMHKTEHGKAALTRQLMRPPQQMHVDTPTPESATQTLYAWACFLPIHFCRPTRQLHQPQQPVDSLRYMTCGVYVHVCVRA